MKTRLATSFIVIVAVLLGTTSAKAQGIIVHKKDGTVIKVPYTELDIISTYNHNEMPSIKTFDVYGVTFNMVFVEGGTFEMGATPEQSNGYTPLDWEYPVHTVTLSDYYIGQTEVTQDLWFAVMNASPSSKERWTIGYGLGDKYPAYWISYYECQEFINKLNDITGVEFRMPTEAEWEYAARGGRKSNGYIFSGSNIIDDVAWFEDNSAKRTHVVGTKAPNELGIYDMSGNVFEWCSDWEGDYSNTEPQTNPTGPSTGDRRGNRGGNWYSNADCCRVAYRLFFNPSNRSDNLGFRLVL